MKIFNPVRWWYQEWLWGFGFRVKNLIRWFPVIWHDDWIDWSYFLKIIRHKLKEMETNYPNGHLVGCEKVAHQTKVCRILCDRLIEDDYFSEQAKAIPFRNGKSAVLHAEYRQKQDIDYLCRTINKYIFGWWN